MPIVTSSTTSSLDGIKNVGPKKTNNNNKKLVTNQIEQIKQQNKTKQQNNGNNKIKNNFDITTSTTTTTTTSTTNNTNKKNKSTKEDEEIEILKIKKKQFESAISNEAKPLFNRIIKFKEAEIQDDSNNQLKLKYKPINNINAYNNVNSAAAKKLLESKKKQQQEEDDDNILAQPKKVIFQPEQLTQLMGWKNVTRIGAGLVNVGNTCFMNSVLQCLTYSVPLVNFMMSREHSKSCNATGFCIFCSLETHIITSHKQAGGNKAITPREIASNIKKIAPTFRIGRQEDSHEFIRFVIESLQKVCLSKFPKGSVSHRDAMTTVIGSLFGGYLRSQVKCSVCQYESNTFDPFMDLCVDINQADSLAKGLQNFVKSEILDGSNKYKCSKCKKLVKAHKRLQIHIAPPLLTCQIKRFSFLGSFGGKINRPIQFDQTLNLSPYMTQTTTSTNNQTIYDLYAVLVHLGGSSSSGHYFCYVKGSNGIWYNMDDSMVSQVSLNTVLSSKAYMLFYSKRNVETSINSNTIINNINKNIVGNKRKIVDENENINNDNDEKNQSVKQEIKKQKVSTTTTTTTSPKLSSSPLLKSTIDEKQKITTTNNSSPKIEAKKSSLPMKSISLANDEEILNRQTSKNDHSSDEEENESDDDDDTYSESSLSGPSSESDNGGISPTLQSSVLSSKPTKPSSSSSSSSSVVVENIHNKSKKDKKEEKKKLETTTPSSKVLNWEESRFAEEDTFEDKKKLKSINNAKQLKENAKIKQDSQFNFNVAKWDDEDIVIDQNAQKELLKDEQILESKHEKDEHNKHYDTGRIKKVKVKKSLNPNETNQFNALSKKYKEQKENQLKFGDNYGSRKNNNNSNKKNNTNSKFGSGQRKKPNNNNKPKKFL